MKLEESMPEPKLKKALITSRYPTARDLARIYHVPMSHINKLAEELVEIQRHNAQTVPGYPQNPKIERLSKKKSATAHTVAKRGGRARQA
jgi:hypothetical protein